MFVANNVVWCAKFGLCEVYALSFHNFFPDKLVRKDGTEWCLDIFDKFVLAGQSVSVGEAVLRRYKPVSMEHNHIVLGIFCSDGDQAVRKINVLIARG